MEALVGGGRQGQDGEREHLLREAGKGNFRRRALLPSDGIEAPDDIGDEEGGIPIGLAAFSEIVVEMATGGCVWHMASEESRCCGDSEVEDAGVPRTHSSGGGAHLSSSGVEGRGCHDIGERLNRGDEELRLSGHDARVWSRGAVTVDLEGSATLQVLGSGGQDQDVDLGNIVGVLSSVTRALEFSAEPLGNNCNGVVGLAVFPEVAAEMMADDCVWCVSDESRSRGCGLVNKLESSTSGQSEGAADAQHTDAEVKDACVASSLDDELNMHEAEIARREEKQSERDYAHIADMEKSIAQRERGMEVERDLLLREEKLQTKAHMFSEREKAIFQRETNLLKMELTILHREADVSERESAILELAKSLLSREARLRQREKTLAEHKLEVEKYLELKAENLKNEEDLVHQLNLQLQDAVEKFERNQEEMKLQWLNAKGWITERNSVLNRGEAELSRREMAVRKERKEHARHSGEITDEFSATTKWRPRLNIWESDSNLADGAGIGAVSSVQAFFHAANLIRYLIVRGGEDDHSLHLPLFVPTPEDNSWNKRKTLYTVIFMIFIPFIFGLEILFHKKETPEEVQIAVFLFSGAIWAVAGIGGLLGLFSRSQYVQSISTWIARIVFLGICLAKLVALWYVLPPGRVSNISVGVLGAFILAGHVGIGIKDYKERTRVVTG